MSDKEQKKVDGPAPGFKKYQESAAYAFNGEGMQLGHDILLYSRYCVFEQGVIDRLSRSDFTLADELNRFEDMPGVIYLGNAEEIREYLHNEIDRMFTTIYGSREWLNEENKKKILDGEVTLDDVIYPNEETTDEE